MTGIEGREDLGLAIAAHRNYLLLVADRVMAPALKTKEGVSDLVQEAMLAAHLAADQVQGRSPVELRSWLRRLLLNRVAHAARRYLGTGKRRLGRERSLAADRSGQEAVDLMAMDQTSPGAAADGREAAERLRAALDRLPERMRQVVLWRHHEECSFDELGRRLDCSNVAARRLWLRALARLRCELSGVDAPPAGPSSN